MPNRKVYGKQKDSMAKQLYDEHSLTVPSSKSDASLSGSKLAHHDRNLTSPAPLPPAYLPNPTPLRHSISVDDQIFPDLQETSTRDLTDHQR